MRDSRVYVHELFALFALLNLFGCALVRSEWGYSMIYAIVKGLI